MVVGATVDCDHRKRMPERCDDIVNVNRVEGELMVVVASVQTEHHTGHNTLRRTRHRPRKRSGTSLRCPTRTVRPSSRTRARDDQDCLNRPGIRGDSR